jgi:glycosyltransferase involved in cell wall biosynthesis
MRICFISPYSPRTVNGIGTFIISLAQYLNKHGHEPLLITKLEKGEIDPCDVFESSDLIEIRHSKVKGLANIHLTLLTLIAIFRMRNKIDILHLQQSHILSVFSCIMGTILGIPIVTTFHVKVSSNGLRKDLFKLFNNILYIFSDSIIYVSEETRKSFCHKGNVIINGTDTEKYVNDRYIRIKTRNELNIENSFVILFLGRIAKNKGIYELIDAIKKINTSKKYDLKVLVVGPIASEDEKKYFEYLKDKDLENCILTLGPHKEVHKFYCSSDIFILPSHLEGLPLSMLEAMSVGLPCIVSRVGGVPEVITHGVNGLLIEVKNSNDLMQKMTWCLENRDILKTLGYAASLTIRERFSIERVAEEYINVYNRVLND